MTSNSDNSDSATEREQFMRDLALQALRQRNNHDSTINAATHCQQDDCGAPIPEARRQALRGCQTCIHCQTRIERTTRFKGR